MKKIVILILLMGLLSGGFVSAQAELPPLEGEMVVQTFNSTFTIGTPIGWQVTVPGERVNNAFGVLSNLTDPGNLPPTEMNVVYQDVNLLFPGIEVDLEAANPALDYFQSYSTARGLVGEGAYADPVAIRDGAVRAALMLFVEETDTTRFGETDVLSLGFATYTGEGEFLLALFEGPANEWITLLSLWNYLLETMTLNGRQLRFDDLSQVLIGFERAESLVTRYAQNDTAPEGAIVAVAPDPGIPQSLLVEGQTLDYFLLEGWEVTERGANSTQMIAERDGAEISLEIVPRPEDMLSINDWFFRRYEDIVIGGAVGFEIRTGLGIAANTVEEVDDETRGGSIIVTEIPEHILIIRFLGSEEVSNESVADWLTFIGNLQLNNREFGRFEFRGVLSSLGQE